MQGEGAVTRVVASGWFLAGTLGLAALLRVSYVLSLRHLPLFDELLLDAAVYDAWARRIAAGDWMGGATAFYQDPLYPYVLAAIYRLVGHDVLAVRLIQVALGVGTCALAALIGRTIGGRAVGNLAAFVVAVYRPAIFQDAEFEKTALGVFLATAAVALALRPSALARGAAGAALALAALTRGNLLLLAPLGVALMLAGEGRRALRGAVAFAACFVVVLAPVTWRNHRVSGEWILTTSGVGQNFYTGNNPWNAWGGYASLPFVRADPAYEERDFKRAAEARLGRALSPSETSAYWLGEARRHIADHPGFAAAVTVRKLALFWSDFEVPDAWDMRFLARYSAALSLPLLGMGCLAPLAAIGAIAAFRRDRRVQALVVLVAAYTLSVVAFFVFSRYRLHVVPLLAVLAGLALQWLARALRAGDYRRLAAAVVGASAVALVSFLGAGEAQARLGDEVQSAVNLAGLYQRHGDPRSAWTILAAAAERAPRNPTPICEMGRLSLWVGDVGTARQYLEACLAARPAHPNAWLALGQVYEAMGMRSAAATAYRRHLEIFPGDPQARELLAAVGG